MVNNPFVVTGKIPDKYFCDREVESERLITLLLNGNNVVLFSPRRMGKTGLIRHCYDDKRIEEEYLTFYVDILQTSSLRELVFLLGKEIYRRLASRGSKIVMGFFQVLKSLSGKFGFDPLNGMPSFDIHLGDISNPELTLEEIFTYLDDADRRCIVAIDEFQQITSYPEKNVEAILRTHIQQSSNANFIFSGSRRHILQEMFLHSARPFYQSSSFLNLDPIPEEVYVSFMTSCFNEFNKVMPAEEARNIYRMFQGHTFYVQRTCNVAFSYTQERQECTQETIDFALDYLLNSYDTLFRANLSSLSERQKELLYAIATEGDAKEITSMSFISRYALPSASSVQSNAKQLLEKDIITRSERTYTVNDRFFAFWLRRMLNGEI